MAAAVDCGGHAPPASQQLPALQQPFACLSWWWWAPCGADVLFVLQHAAAASPCVCSSWWHWWRLYACGAAAPPPQHASPAQHAAVTGDAVEQAASPWQQFDSCTWWWCCCCPPTPRQVGDAGAVVASPCGAIRWVIGGAEQSGAVKCRVVQCLRQSGTAFSSRFAANSPRSSCRAPCYTLAAAGGRTCGRTPTYVEALLYHHVHPAPDPASARPRSTSARSCSAGKDLVCTTNSRAIGAEIDVSVFEGVESASV